MATITEEQRVLVFTEAEGLIKSLKVPVFKTIGSQEWQRNHEYLEKLNLQALLSADSQEDEYVNELFNTHAKIEVLVEDLLMSEVWKSYVFPIIARTNFQPESTIPLYMALYHEATLINLLETLYFHSESVESSDDVCIDLLDYCYRKLIHVTKTGANKHQKQQQQPQDIKDEVNSMRELREQAREIDFGISVKSISILRYITDALENLPLSVSTRMMKTLNIPCLLVELIQNPPWVRRDGSKLEKHIDGKWQDVKVSEMMKMTKIEAQSWLALYNLMSPKYSAKYDFTDFNKAQLLKLRANLNDVIVDQLPVLIDFRRFLEQLAITQTQPPQTDLVLEQLPEIRERIMKENQGKFEAIAKHQMIKYFNPTRKQIKEHAKRLAKTYDYEIMDSLIKEVPHCASCGEEASKRCSRCRHEWYCKRECQVSHWKQHKKMCDVYLGYAT